MVIHKLTWFYMYYLLYGASLNMIVKSMHYITANDSHIYVIDITNMNTGKPMIVLLIYYVDII